MDNIAIVGVGQTVYEKRKKEKTVYDMVYEVACKAMDDAGFALRDIDNVITVSNDFVDGRTISSMAVQEAAGAYDKNVSTIEGDGAFGAFYGAMRVLGGYGTTLVVAHAKGSEGDSEIISNAMFDPVYQRLLGIDAVSAAAVQANAYLEKYGISEEQCALVSVKNHGNAKRNPFAHLPLDLTVDDVMRSRKIADPLKLYDCSPISDGASAIIIASEERAATARSKPAWIKGIAHCSDAYLLGDRDLSDPRSLRAAARKAYSMAGIVDPLKDIDVVELYDAFTFMEFMWLEGLGFCEPGTAAALAERGVTEMDGDLPTSVSGGVLSSHPLLVAGLARVVEAALQVRGDAGDHQVDNVKTALAHGINGPCGQSHCVWILGRE